MKEDEEETTDLMGDEETDSPEKEGATIPDADPDAAEDDDEMDTEEDEVTAEEAEGEEKP